MRKKSPSLKPHDCPQCSRIPEGLGTLGPEAGSSCGWGGGIEVQNECRPCLVKCPLSGAFCWGKQSSLTTEQVAIWLQVPHGMSFSCQLCTWWALPASELTSQIIQIFSCWAGPLGRWIIFNLAHHGMREGKKTTKGPEFWNLHDSLVFLGAARRWSWEH